MSPDGHRKVMYGRRDRARKVPAVILKRQHLVISWKGEQDEQLPLTLCLQSIMWHWNVRCVPARIGLLMVMYLSGTITKFRLFNNHAD
ncbi:hypothetical protein PsorP6_015940 [Peronosclerospora sorghi]|uniref:Uncharacterized protein n=1 Tax=Peronosclerospora sorghi TaxID=230839 RepID=A0ACC0WMA8_9STRA|nr:hypothetical protein PsorP6_015940 [Peronosclerospora sorghi]